MLFIEKWLRFALPFLAEILFLFSKSEKAAAFSDLHFHGESRSCKMQCLEMTSSVKKGETERPQAHRFPENKNILSAVIVRAKRRQF